MTFLSIDPEVSRGHDSTRIHETTNEELFSTSINPNFLEIQKKNKQASKLYLKKLANQIGKQHSDLLHVAINDLFVILDDLESSENIKSIQRRVDEIYLKFDDITKKFQVKFEKDFDHFLTDEKLQKVEDDMNDMIDQMRNKLNILLKNAIITNDDDNQKVIQNMKTLKDSIYPIIKELRQNFKEIIEFHHL